MNIFGGGLIEQLESRFLMTAVFTGKLDIIDGTSRPDTITVQKSTSADGDMVNCQIVPKLYSTDGTQSSLSQTARVIVRASTTRDVLTVDPAVTDLVDFIPDDTTGAHVFGATLAIAGGKGNDVIRIYRNRGQINDITVVINGQESQFSSATVKAIFIAGNRGDDDIAIAKINLPNAIFGGDGNDSIEGGAEEDYILGELGDDTLRGGAGNDQLVGQLSGPGEADLIDGGDGDDSIVAEGATVFGGNGDDSLFVNAGSSQFTGGEGHDSMASPSNFSNQIFTDFSSRKDRYQRIH
jgi:Ca2+-binding RTX toxin-like protein